MQDRKVDFLELCQGELNYAVIACRQLNGTDFVLQIAGSCIPAGVGFQNFPGDIATPS